MKGSPRGEGKSMRRIWNKSCVKCVVKPNLNYMWFARLVGPTGGVCVCVFQFSVLCLNLCSVLHWPFPPTGWSKRVTHGCMLGQNRKLSLSGERCCLSWTWLRTICFQTERNDTPINSQSLEDRVSFG